MESTSEKAEKNPAEEIFTREYANKIAKLLPPKTKAKIARDTGHNKGTVSAVLNGNVGNYKSDSAKDIIKRAMYYLKKAESDIIKERKELQKLIGA